MLNEQDIKPYGARGCPPRLLAWVFLAVMISGCGRCGWGTYYRRGINGYSGDGKIYDVSQGSGFLGGRGYVIQFPTFDLGERHQAEFQLSHLPTLGNARAQISLLIEDPTVEERKGSLHAETTCLLKNSSGTVVAEFSQTLDTLIWSSPVHGRRGHALYNLDRSFFRPQSNTRYTLTVFYSGEPQIKGTTGYFYIWCGCGGS